MGKSYTTAKNPIPFDIDGEQFTTIPAVPAGLMLDLTDIDGGKETMETFFETVLDEDSHARFTARLRDKTNPIDQPTLMKVMKDLSEEIAGGDRPFELPSGSPDGSAPTSPSSTESAPSEA